MNCFIDDFSIINDVNDRIKSCIIEKVHSPREQYVLGAKINDDSFYNWAFQNVESFRKEINNKKLDKTNFAKINKNTLASAIKMYHNYLFPKVSNYADTKNADTLNGFENNTAKREAIQYTGNIISELYLDNLSASKDKKVSDEADLLNKVAIRIINANRARARAFIGILKETEITDKEITKLESIFSEIKELNEKIKSGNNKIYKLSKINRITVINKKDKEEIARIDKEIKETKIEVITSSKKKNVLTEKIDTIYYYLINEYAKPSIINGYEKFLNFNNLAELVRSEVTRKEWMKTAFASSKMLKYKDEFEEALESDKLSTSLEEDSADVTNSDSENVDETTKSWESALSADYRKLYSTKFKLILDNLYNLVQPISEDNKTPIYDTNNELGVPMTRGAAFYVTQLSEFANFDSIETFISSVEEASNSIPELYSLSLIVDRMKKDREFANYVFSQTAKPRMEKMIVYLNENGFQFKRSNIGIKSSENTYFILYNTLKTTYKSKFNKDTINKINSHLSTINALYRLKTIEERKIAFSDSTKNIIFNDIYEILKGYFPFIKEDSLIGYLYNSNNIVDNFKTILTQLKNLEDGIARYAIAQYEHDDEVIKENAGFDKTTGKYDKSKSYNARLERYEQEIAFNPKAEYPVRKYSEFQEDAYNKNIAISLANISEILSKSNIANIELNHSNGEGNLESDLIGNSYITNILKQIQSKSIDTQSGLKKLAEAVTKSDQYKYNPILFGLKDINGRTIVNGLFSITSNNSVVINKDADKLLNFVLFSGIRNNDTNEGTVYSKMSKADYLITNLIAYAQGNIENLSQETNTAGFFTRIPSDAGKTFIAQTISFESRNLYNPNEKEKSDYLSSVKKVILSNYNIDNSSFDKFNKEILSNLRTYKSNNITDKQLLLNILKNNGISEFNHSGLISKKTTDKNKERVPLIYYKETISNNKKTRTPSFVIWIEGDIIPEKANTIKDAKIVSINSLSKYTNLASLDKTYTSAIEEISNFLNNEDINNSLIEEGISTNKISININRNSQLYNALYWQIISELDNYISQLNNVFEYDEVTKTYVSKTDITGLFENAHFIKTIVGKDGKLTGNFFKFSKLFDVNGKSYSERLESVIPLQGVKNSLIETFTDSDGNTKLRIDPSRLKDSFINYDDTNRDRPFSYKGSTPVEGDIQSIIDEWLINYNKDIEKLYQEYKDIIPDEVKKVTKSYTATKKDLLRDWVLNSTVINMMFDDLLEGSAKFYKDAQTFLKRAKEIQMSGSAYAGFDINDDFYGDVKTLLDNTGKEIDIKIGDLDIPIKARNGFKAVTIYNTVRPFERVRELHEEVKQEILKEVKDEAIAESLASEISKGFAEDTKTNDAQSYITIDEFIRRKWAEGTLNEYIDLIKQLLDPNVKIENIDLKDVNKRIQLQKNVYYDIQYDAITKTYYPRQIKNAEFVLIPKLLPKNSDLYRLYEVMKEKGIDQLNTAETIKAGKRNVLTLWDNEGKAHFDTFSNSINNNTIENYYYRYLYKQQDVVDHMQGETNKIGIQIAKKIQDNLSTASPKVKEAVEKLQRNYVANIKDSFNKLIFRLGFEIDETGRLVNREYPTKDAEGNTLPLDVIERYRTTLNYASFYERARTEAIRLGMDDNFLEYLTPNELGTPDMPNYMNNASTKLESIAQSIFNSMIARQKLPGWHAAQLTNVGYDKKLEFHPAIYKNKETNDTIKFNEYNKLSEEEKAKYEIKQEAWAQILLPRWSKLIPQRPKDSKLTQEEWDAQILAKLESEGLDIHIGYRIPTEGKQSVSVLKVVGFLDESYGSTIMVPDAWVTQTGSDFDIDTVYGMMYEFYVKNGNFYKIQADYDTTEEGYRRRYIAYIKDIISDRIKASDEYGEANDSLKEAFNKISDIKGKLRDAKTLGKIYAKINELRDDSDLAFADNIIYEKTETYKKLLTEYELYEDIVNTLSFINKTETNPEVSNKLNELIDCYTSLIDLQDVKSNLTNGKGGTYKTKELRELKEEAYNEYFIDIQNIAEELHLISYEDFVSLPVEEQQNRAARNNAILDAFVEIMEDPSSREENYSRSNFDTISRVKKYLENIAGVSSAKASAYSPISQLQFMENAINGRKLKAFSVDRDTFNSINNKVQTRLSNTASIKVVYDLNKYNKKLIEDAFDNVDFDTIPGKAIVTHNTIGWTKNNRNVAGNILTVYSSQTTAHILDAIKEGALYNETDYTFGTFKTLIDVGIDYDTAIAFLMQPAVTLLNKYNFQKNSVYTSNNINVIDTAIKDIAAKLGIKVNGNDVTPYTNIKDLFNELKNNEELNRAFIKQFGVSLREFNSMDDINIMLDRESLENRLKLGQSTEYNTNYGDTSSFDVAVYDLGMIFAFRKFYNTTKVLESVMRLVTPDSFGAKQTIHETRKKLEDIKAIAADFKEETAVNKTIYTLDKDGNRVRFIDSIYPGFASGEIREYDSSYPYLAAMLKYCTQQSVEINKDIFTLEKDEIYNTISEVQKFLGINFNEEQYAEFKKFIINDAYNHVPLLMSPIKLNKAGFVTIDKEAIKNSETFNYWENERGRIFGYIEGNDNLEIDINNYTDDDIKLFSKLTPLQKVLFIQQNFTGDNIFNYLKTNKYNAKQLYTDGFSNNYIRFADSIEDVNNLHLLFRQAFFNKNPFIRLAAIDLVKYAFVVEGFNFKKGAITKLITNDAIKGKINDKGLSLIDDLNKIVYSLTDFNKFLETGYLDDFIRSHAEVIKEIKFNKVNGQISKENILLNACKDSTGLVFIPNTENYKSLIDNLKIKDADRVKSYVKINAYVSSTGNRELTLYKIYKGIKGIYLIPLNLLERNEIASISINSKNNKHFPYEFYQELIEASNNDITLLKDRKGDEYEVYNSLIGKKDSKRIPRYRYDINTTEYNGPEFINDLLSKDDLKSAERDKLNDFITETNIAFGTFGTSDSHLLVWNESDNLAKITSGNKKVYLNIDINGQTELFEVSRYNKNVLNDRRDFGYTAQEINVRQKLSGTIIRSPKVYKLSLVVSETINKENEEDAKQSIDETFELNPSMIGDFDYAENIRSLNRSPFEKIDRVGYYILNDIYSNEVKNDFENSTNFFRKLAIKNINRNSLRSISNNRKTVYTSAAKYYANLSKYILNQLKEFTLSNGQKFNVSDPELYKALREFPDDANRLINLILKARVFGRTIQGIFELDIIGEDTETQNAIESIKNSISSIRDSKEINDGITLIFNSYLAKEYSTNPNMVIGLSDITDVWKDTDWFDYNIGDTRATDNKQIQLIMKLINGRIAAARYESIRNQEKFRKELKELIGDNFNWDRIVDENGKLVSKYTDDFLKDKEELKDKVTEANLKLQEVIANGNENEITNAILEYEKVKLERDIWRAENLEQEIVKDYYVSKNTIIREVLQNAPNEFARYKRLRDLIYNVLRDTNSLSEDERNLRKTYLAEYVTLTSEFNSDGTRKSEEEVKRVKALKKYNESIYNLNTKYFDVIEADDFRKALKTHLDFITKFDNENPDKTILEKLENDSYRESYQWIQDNARRVLNDDLKTKIGKAFDDLYSEKFNPFTETYTKFDSKDKYDIYGVINGLAFEQYSEEHPDDDIVEQIREITEDSYTIYRDEDDKKIDVDNSLIKEIPTDLPVFNEKFYETFDSIKDIDSEIVKKQKLTIKEINDLLKKGLDTASNQISSELLFNNLTEEELKRLAELYSILRNINKDMYAKIDEEDKNTDKTKTVSIKRTNTTAFEREYTWFKENVANNSKRTLWLSIFCEIDNKGRFALDKKGNFKPNRLIYGYVTPKKVNNNGVVDYDSEFVDTKKTKAKKFISENVIFTETKYYHEAIDYHTRKGDFDEWYKKNHVYNPYTRKMEPLRIWRTMEVNPAKYDPDTVYTFIPTGDNIERSIKSGKNGQPDYRNPKYSRYSTNYNPNGRYTNPKYTNLTAKEKEVIDFVQQTLNQFTINKEASKFFNKGYLPRQYAPVQDARWLGKEIAGAIGLEMGNYSNRSWHDDISYEKDFDADFSMARILSVKGYEQEERIEKQAFDETDTEYNNRVKIVRKANEERRKRNLEREKAFLDRDWAKVLENFVGEATIYQEKAKVKNLAYLMLEDLRTREAYKVSPFGHIKTKATSPVEEEQYQTTPQTRSYNAFQNFVRRRFFDEYRKESKLTPLADLMQNITAAKYMIFNVTGGISNVLTGMVNVMGETFAGQFFDGKSFGAAQAQYLNNSLGFLASSYSDKAPNLTIALTKLFNIVDMDAITERRKGESIAEWSNRIRNSLYSFQSMGEHYMQNTVLLAVLKSNKLFTGLNGKLTFGNFNDYTINVNNAALRKVINDDTELKLKYDILLANIKKNLDQKRKYDLFIKDFSYEFIKSIGDKTTRDRILKEYNETRKELLKEAKKEFNELPNLESQFYFDNGYAKIKPNSQLTKEMFGQIKNRVEIINTKIHGVYDKIGAAKIESEWWGGLVMQYHKHIYPGIMKRFRRNAFYHETLGIVEKGSYISLWDLLTKDFENFKDRVDNRVNNDNTHVAIASIIETTKTIWDCITNIKFNYSTLPVWEQQNLKRILGDLLGITSALLLALAIYALTDDDDREDSDLINTGIYLADRLFSESIMYTPWGLISEARTLWSSPIASTNGPEDLLKGMNYAIQWMFNSDFDPNYKTGLYAGQNKLAVLALRNVPFYRVINRIENMSENNSYYRINESSFNIGMAANIAEIIKD